MMVNSIEGCTRRLGKSQGYIGLPIRDEVIEHGIKIMVSSWQPTPAELVALAAGASIHLTVLGSEHPPVLLEVCKPPEE